MSSTQEFCSYVSKLDRILSILTMTEGIKCCGHSTSASAGGDHHDLDREFRTGELALDAGAARGVAG